jgi:hypothetical protein
MFTVSKEIVNVIVPPTSTFCARGEAGVDPSTFFQLVVMLAADVLAAPSCPSTKDCSAPEPWQLPTESCRTAALAVWDPV